MKPTVGQAGSLRRDGIPPTVAIAATLRRLPTGAQGSNVANLPHNGLSTLYVSPGRNDVDENRGDRRRVKVVMDSGDGETVTLF
jgi:hypothetical protein